jgi:hypothetical protein
MGRAWYTYAMSKIFTLKDLQQAAPKVIERLNAMALLPAHGTVAGQAVASLFFEELGHVAGGPVNDIDVFVNTNMPRKMRGLEELEANHVYQGSNKVQPTVQQLKDISVEVDDYQRIKFIALRSTLRIMRTYQVGLINYTLIQSPDMVKDEPGHDDNVSSAIVGGFDLNVVGVGINLNSGKVVASDGFLEFLNTARIRVETCNTPAHTMARLAKKFYGGEITGATCDFAAERAMLELALSCQEQGTLEGSGDYLSTVTRFGGGKYKALYDRFADVLPPIKAIPHVLTDGTTYTFFSICPKAPVDACDLALFQLASRKSNAALPYFVRQNIFVADFPQIYDLFHPERSNLSTNEVMRRRAEFESMDPKHTGGFNIRCLQRALGRQMVDLQVPGMDEDDSAMFFYNQACAENLKCAQAAIDAFQAIKPIECKVLLSINERGDTALALRNARADTWKALLESNSNCVLEEVCKYRDDGGRAEAASMILEMLEWMQEMGPIGTQIANKLLPLRKENNDTSSTFKSVVGIFPEGKQAEVALRLMNWVAPTWPDLAAESANVRRRALANWASVGQPVPVKFWERLPAEELPRCIEAVCSVFRYDVKTDKKSRDNFYEILGQCAHGLTPEQMAAEDGLVLRAALCVGGVEALARTLVTMPIHQKVQEALQNIILKIRTKNQSQQTFESMVELDQWYDITEPARTIAGIELLCMESGVASQTKLTPRAAPRL